ESLVWIVDAVASKVEPDGIIVARNLGEPLARFDRIEFPIDIDRLELVNQHDRRIAIGGEIAGGYSDLKWVVWPIAELRHDHSCLLTVFVDVAVPTNRPEQLGRPPPPPLRRRQHRAAGITLPLENDIDHRLAVDRQSHRFAQLDVVERRVFAVNDEIDADVDRSNLADRARILPLDVGNQRLRHFGWEGHVDLAGDEGQHGGCAGGNAGEIAVVPIRPTFFSMNFVFFGFYWIGLV